MKELFKTWIQLVIIGAIVTYGWQGLEILMIGRINPNNVDSVIGLILTFSLYGNWRMLIKYIKK